MRFLYIKSIPKTWTGDDNNGSLGWVDPKTNKPLNRSKVLQGVGTYFSVGYSPRIGGYATGLYKPWIENGQQKVENGKPLTLQDYYEKKHNVPSGTYHNRPSDVRGQNMNKEETRSFYEINMATRLVDGTNVFNLDEPLNELWYEAFLESPFVANSEKEWREHKWPKAQFYIAMENESDEIKFTRTHKVSKALAQLHDDDLTLPYKRILLVVLGIVNSRTVLSEEQVHNLLFDYIESSKTGVASNIDKFTELFTLLKTPKGKSELEARFLLQKLVDYRIVAEKQGSYTWLKATGPIVLGENYTEAIDFLLSPKKIALVDELKQELSFKE